MDQALLEEVTHLVERPTALWWQFRSAYLEVPSEILVTTMKEHQKYFPVRTGCLLPVFVAVRNGDDTSLDVVRSGNEKVLSARLAERSFSTRKISRRPSPTVWMSSRRRLSGATWNCLGEGRGMGERRAVAAAHYSEERDAEGRSDALLCKADLVTHVVYEFPELQGVMGNEYALRSGEDIELPKRF